MSSRIESNNVICIDPHAGRLPLDVPALDRQLKQWRREDRVTRALVYVGLAAFLAAFWAGVIWLLEK